MTDGGRVQLPSLTRLQVLPPADRDVYEVLGVPTDASTAAIEAAYRERLKEPILT